MVTWYQGGKNRRGTDSDGQPGTPVKSKGASGAGGPNTLQRFAKAKALGSRKDLRNEYEALFFKCAVEHGRSLSTNKGAPYKARHPRSRGTPCSSRSSVAAWSKIFWRRSRPGSSSASSPRVARRALA